MIEEEQSKSLGVALLSSSVCGDISEVGATTWLFLVWLFIYFHPRKNLHCSLLPHLHRPGCQAGFQTAAGDSVWEKHWDRITLSPAEIDFSHHHQRISTSKVGLLQQSKGHVAFIYKKEPASTWHAGVWRKGYVFRAGSLSAAVYGRSAILLLAGLLEVLNPATEYTQSAHHITSIKMEDDLYTQWWIKKASAVFPPPFLFLQRQTEPQRLWQFYCAVLSC